MNDLFGDLPTNTDPLDVARRRVTEAEAAHAETSQENGSPTHVALRNAEYELQRLEHRKAYGEGAR